MSIGGARLPSRCDAFLIQGVMGATLSSDDRISEVTRRLSELLAIVEYRPAEDRVRDAASTEAIAPAALPAPQDDDTGVAMITLRFDTQILAQVDTAAKRLGISRAAWLHLAAAELLKDHR